MRSSHAPSKLFVGDLGDNRKSELARLFSKYGEISTIYIDEHKHFAFIDFASSIDAQRALEHTHNKTLNGSKLRVEYAKPDKNSRDNRRPVSRDDSPTAALYNHLQVTANRLPSLNTFRHSYYQHYPAPMTRNGIGTSRGRSLTPPSLKQNSYLPPMHPLRPHDLHYHHPTMYNDSAYYRTYGDPYLMQRLPPPGFLPSTSSPPPLSSRAYRNMHSSSGVNRYAPALSHHQRSRSRHRASSSHRNQSSRERKHKRRSSSSSEQSVERGPRTPPPKLPKKRSKARSRSRSDSDSSTSEEKMPSHSSSDESDDETKRSSARRSVDDDSDRKNSKNKKRE